jgi:small subunit ribosomal protein S4
MTKRLESKYKISRRIGESLWGRAKDPVNKRNYAPGQHGMARKRKLGGYAQQLNEKQKLKGYYGSITERQFRKVYAEAARRKGDTSENLVGLLERRLDAVVYRMGIVPTVFSARQVVSHGHIQVNGKRVNIPSYQVKEGDEISVKETSKQMPLILGSVQTPERSVPEYVEFDEKAMKGKFIRAPKLAEIPYPVVMQPNLVVEYYSR